MPTILAEDFLFIATSSDHFVIFRAQLFMPESECA
jgi:hypothetical protein